ncbi:MAG: SLAP domain-containing protein [Clostridia bacterium]|nr:SLAP domain-containing protein [Clostridia bacterium]
MKKVMKSLIAVMGIVLLMACVTGCDLPEQMQDKAHELLDEMMTAEGNGYGEIIENFVEENKDLFEQMQDTTRTEQDASADETVTDETVKEEVPAAKEEAPAAKEEAPDVKEEAPVEKEEAPAAKEKAPAAKEEAPAAKEEAPAAKEEAPVVKEEAPAVKEEAPAMKEEAPAMKEPPVEETKKADYFFNNTVDGRWTPNAISVAAKEVYFKDGKLVVHCFIVNGFSTTATNVSITEMNVVDKDGKVIASACFNAQNLTMDPLSYVEHTFTFGGDCIVNTDVDMAVITTNARFSARH